ncbi:MAG: NADPH-dependent FMN reductase [Salibacteraceae bacterium]
MKTIIAFSGSNSSRSINQHLIRLVAPLFTAAEVKVLDLRDFPAPMYGIDLEEAEGIPESMQQLMDEFRASDGIVLSTPEHNGSMPAFLKNAIDWLSRIEKKPSLNKPMLLLSASPGARGAQSAFEHLNAILPYRGAAIVAGHRVGSFFAKVEEGELHAEEKAQLIEVVRQMEKAVLE